MGKHKLICLTPRLLEEDNVEKQFVNTRYITPLKERGFNTIMLTLDNINNEEILSLCDGFLITGGTDLDPANYEEDNKEDLSKNIDKRLDELDKLVVKHALNKEKPLLGICRGLQSLNVFLGGSLIQDLGEGNACHLSKKEDHFVKIVSDNKFNLNGELNVNSYHHQAIKKLANEVEALAYHLDGTIEMISHKNLPMIAVQWHPEIRHTSKESKLIFDIFANFFKEKKRD